MSTSSMNQIIESVIIAVIAVVVFTVIYRLVPFKAWGDKKPGFSFFPKYVAPYNKPVQDIKDSLTKLGFKETENKIYRRGKVYGDFSAKAIKLSVIVDESANQVKVYASFFGILFDTGDLWQVTSDIVNG